MQEGTCDATIAQLLRDVSQLPQDQHGELGQQLMQAIAGATSLEAAITSLVGPDADGPHVVQVARSSTCEFQSLCIQALAPAAVEFVLTTRAFRNSDDSVDAAMWHLIETLLSLAHDTALTVYERPADAVMQLASAGESHEGLRFALSDLMRGGAPASVQRASAALALCMLAHSTELAALWCDSALVDDIAAALTQHSDCPAVMRWAGAAVVNLQDAQVERQLLLPALGNNHTHRQTDTPLPQDAWACGWDVPCCDTTLLFQAGAAMTRADTTSNLHHSERQRLRPATAPAEQRLPARDTSRQGKEDQQQCRPLSASRRIMMQWAASPPTGSASSALPVRAAATVHRARLPPPPPPLPRHLLKQPLSGLAYLRQCPYAAQLRECEVRRAIAQVDKWRQQDVRQQAAAAQRRMAAAHNLDCGSSISNDCELAAVPAGADCESGGETAGCELDDSSSSVHGGSSNGNINGGKSGCGGSRGQPASAHEQQGHGKSAGAANFVPHQRATHGAVSQHAVAARAPSTLATAAAAAAGMTAARKPRRPASASARMSTTSSSAQGNMAVDKGHQPVSTAPQLPSPTLKQQKYNRQRQISLYGDALALLGPVISGHAASVGHEAGGNSGMTYADRLAAMIRSVQRTTSPVDQAPHSVAPQ